MRSKKTKNPTPVMENEEVVEKTESVVEQAAVPPVEEKPTVTPVETTAAPEEPIVGGEVQLVIFRLGNEEYGVDIHEVREIIKIPDITHMPNAPVFIAGIINLRGKIVVVINLLKRFGSFEEEEQEGTHIIIAEVNGSSFGVLVDDVSEVLTISKENIRKSPSILSTKIHTDYLKGIGIIEEGKRLLIMLDLPKILSEKEMAEMAELTKGMKVNKAKPKKKKVDLTDAQIATLLKKQEKRLGKKGSSNDLMEEAYEEKELYDKGEEMAKDETKKIIGQGATATVDPAIVAEIVKQVMASQK